MRYKIHKCPAQSKLPIKATFRCLMCTKYWGSHSLYAQTLTECLAWARRAHRQVWRSPEGKGCELAGGGQRGRKWGRREASPGHTLQCADEVLLSCARETCMVLRANVTLINSIKNMPPPQKKQVGKLDGANPGVWLQSSLHHQTFLPPLAESLMALIFFHYSFAFYFCLCFFVDILAHTFCSTAGAAREIKFESPHFVWKYLIISAGGDPRRNTWQLCLECFFESVRNPSWLSSLCSKEVAVGGRGVRMQPWRRHTQRAGGGSQGKSLHWPSSRSGEGNSWCLLYTSRGAVSSFPGSESSGKEWLPQPHNPSPSAGPQLPNRLECSCLQSNAG